MSNKNQPLAEEQEEMTVIVLRFKGSSESLSKGFDAVSQALAAVSFSPAPLTRNLPIRHRSPPPSATMVDDSTGVDSDDEDFEGEMETVTPKTDRKAPAVPRKRSPLKFDSTLDLSQGDTWKAYCELRSPQTDSDKYVVAAAWLQEQGERPLFRARDLFTCFRAMGWAEHKDFTQPMRQLAYKKSYFESLGKGGWQLTQLGLDAANSLNNQAN